MKSKLDFLNSLKPGAGGKHTCTTTKAPKEGQKVFKCDGCGKQLMLTRDQEIEEFNASIGATY
ncbi:MAG: hypothetical protein ACXABY_09465 [Candidatus Thorarchaeota archaeon]